MKRRRLEREQASTMKQKILFFRIRSAFKLQVATFWVETLKVAGGEVR